MLDDNPTVSKVEFVSKAQALREEKAKNPEAYQLLGSNPLPDTFRVTPKDPDKTAALISSLAPQTPGGGVDGGRPADRHRQVLEGRHAEDPHRDEGREVHDRPAWRSCS